MCSISDTFTAAINGAATGATPAPEARCMVMSRLTSLLTDVMTLAPANVNIMDLLHENYGITFEVRDGYVTNVFLN